MTKLTDKDIKDLEADTKDIQSVVEDVFFPEGYEVPSSGGNYMKFEKGDNIFRILQKPILGWELWIGKKPKRYRFDEQIPMEEVEKADIDERTGEPKPVKHFWALLVWNYKDKKVQILEITQKKVQQALKALMRSRGWEDPKKYDISVIREGDGFDTTYNVIPNPPAQLSSDAQKAWDSVNSKVRIEALYDGGDPFQGA